MRWTVHGERTIYSSEWVELALVDVEIPHGRRFEHHVIRSGRPAAGVVIYDEDQGVLLLWRHRFITDSWGWEIPAGRVDEGESTADAAAREAIEETGWRPLGLTPLVSFHPMNGISDGEFHIFSAAGAEPVGEPTDPGESERIEWVPVAELRGHIEAGRVPDGLSLTALTYAFAFGPLAHAR